MHFHNGILSYSEKMPLPVIKPLNHVFLPRPHEMGRVKEPLSAREKKGKGVEGDHCRLPVPPFSPSTAFLQTVSAPVSVQLLELC